MLNEWNSMYHVFYIVSMCYFWIKVINIGSYQAARNIGLSGHPSTSAKQVIAAFILYVKRSQTHRNCICSYMYHQYNLILYTFDS